MGLREKINHHQTVIAGTASAAIVLSLAFVSWECLGGRTSGAPASKAFYSDDDGKTWFVDDRAKLPPFDHNGKVAVRAEIFRCKGGPPFVGYLERYSDAVKARRRSADAAHANSFTAQMMDEPMEVRKPGQTKWVTGNAARSVTPTCPDGSTDGLMPVFPFDRDNGKSN